jgi:hypothetical protein
MWNLKVSVSGSAAASGRASGAGLESGGGKGRWSAKRKGGVDLVLPGHKRLAPQKGQHGSCRIHQAGIAFRMLAIEAASKRRPGLRAAPRAVVGWARGSCQGEPSGTRPGEKRLLSATRNP